MKQHHSVIRVFMVTLCLVGLLMGCTENKDSSKNNSQAPPASETPPTLVNDSETREANESNVIPEEELGAGWGNFGSSNLVQRRTVSLRFVSQPLNTLADGTLPPVRVEAVDSVGLRNWRDDGWTEITLSILDDGSENGDAQLLGTTTLEFTDGLAEFTDLRIDQPGNHFRLAVSVDGVSPRRLSTAFSEAFSIISPSDAGLGRLRFTSQPTNTRTASTMLPIRVEILNAKGQRDTSDNTSVVTIHLFETSSQSSVTVFGPPETRTGTVFNGQITFPNVSFRGAGKGNRLIAFSDNPLHISELSDAFDIESPGAPFLFFSGMPNNVLPDNFFGNNVAVFLLDEFGNVMGDDFSTIVTLSIGRDPSNGNATLTNLGNSLSLQVSGGSASFNNLTIDHPERGYTLEAAAPGFKVAESTAFDVITPASIAFVDSVTSVNTFEAIPFEVELRDEGGRRIYADSGGPVTLEVPSDFPFVELEGSLSRIFIDGRALFDDVRIFKPHQDIRIRAKYTVPGTNGLEIEAFHEDFDVEDSPLHFVFTNFPFAAQEFVPFPVNVQLLNTNNELVPIDIPQGAAITVSQGGTIVPNNGDFRTDIVGGIASFNVITTSFGSGFSVRVTEVPTGLNINNTISSFFDVLPTPPTHLELITPIGDTIQGDILETTAGTTLIVRVVNADGSTESTDSYVRQIQARFAPPANHPGPLPVLNGTTIVPVNNGLARFLDLSFSHSENVLFGPLRVQFRPLDTNGDIVPGIIVDHSDFNLLPRPSLNFVTQPADTKERHAMKSISVEVLDASGARDTSDNSTSVMLRIANDPSTEGNALLLDDQSTFAVSPVVNGVATFRGVHIRGGHGTSFTLEAISVGAGNQPIPNPQQTESRAFNVTPFDHLVRFDFNGDGFEDTIIGDPHASTGGVSNTGAAYIFFGDSRSDPQLDTTQADVELRGPSSFVGGTFVSGESNFGFSVASAGDFNGDGYDDAIVGANLEDNSKGAAYIYYGKPSPSPIIAASSASIHIAGVNEFEVAFNNQPDHADFFGGSVASAGDFNGDGIGDLIIGQHPPHPFARESTGNMQLEAISHSEAFIFLGSVAAPPGNRTSDDAEITLRGDDSDHEGNHTIGKDMFGATVSSAGDFNGDGIGDVIVGAARNGGKALGGGTRTIDGSALIFYGSGSYHNTTNIVICDLPSQNFDGDVGSCRHSFNDDALYANVLINGIYDFDTTNIMKGFGISVSGAGDVNGDGLADVIIGALESRILPSNESDDGTGSAHIFYGTSDPALNTLGDHLTFDTSSPHVTTLTGVNVGEQFGYAVEGLGDVNNDGLSDVGVGAPNFGTTFRAAGAAHVFFAANPFPSTTSASADHSFFGNHVDEQLGYDLGAAGDFNGDGIKDFTIASPGFQTNPGSLGSNDTVGAASLYFGEPSGRIATSADILFTGAEVNSAFGWSIGN